MSLTKRLFKTIAATALITSLAVPVFAKDVFTRIGYNQNIYSDLKGKEISIGILHKPSGLGMSIDQGELNYSETGTEKSPEPFVDRIEKRLDAKAQTIGMSVFYNPTDNKINFVAKARAFTLADGEGKATATIYGKGPFENMTLSKEEKANFSGEGHEISAGISVGDKNFRLNLLASSFHIQGNYAGVEADPIDLMGLTGKIGVIYNF